MQIDKVVEGDEVSMPLVSLGNKGGGITRVKSLVNGLLVSLTPQESFGGLLFITEEDLNKAGYFGNVKQAEPEEPKNEER